LTACTRIQTSGFGIDRYFEKSKDTCSKRLLNAILQLGRRCYPEFKINTPLIIA